MRQYLRNSQGGNILPLFNSASLTGVKKMLWYAAYNPATSCRETPGNPPFLGHYQDVIIAMRQTFQIDPEERTWAVIAHLSSLAGYVIPGCGVIVPIIIIFAKSESPMIQAIAKQALYLTILCFLSVVPITLLSITLIGIPLAILMGGTVLIVMWAFPIIGAVKAADGHFFKYPIVGQNPIYYS